MGNLLLPTRLTKHESESNEIVAPKNPPVGASGGQVPTAD